MNKLQIRSASPADANALSDVIHRAVRTSSAPDYDPAVIELLCASFTPEKIIAQMSERDVFAAMLDAAIVGTVSFGRAKGRLNALFVDPQLHRKGVGARLATSSSMPPVQELPSCGCRPRSRPARSTSGSVMRCTSSRSARTARPG